MSLISIEFQTFAPDQSEDTEQLPTITIFENNNNFYLGTNLDEIAIAILHLVPHLDTNYRSSLTFNVNVLTGNCDQAFLSFLRSQKTDSPPRIRHTFYNRQN
jgi:hypothetical protein